MYYTLVFTGSMTPPEARARLNIDVQLFPFVMMSRYNLEGY